MVTPVEALLELKLRQILAEATTRAIAQGIEQTNRGFVKFASRLASASGNSTDLRNAHKRVGSAMQRAVLESYGLTVEGRKVREGLTYRSGVTGVSRRYAGGALRRALEDKRMVRADAQGIDFIDQAILNQEARHWARLNFGAGDPGGGSKRVRLRLFGQSAGTIGFDIAPRRAFQMPTGFFVEPGSFHSVKFSGGGHRHEFVPMSTSTSGHWSTIRGRHFLEAGLDALRIELPKEYEALLSKWIRKSL